MGSVSQIGLGILVLGGAFVFGHYVNENSQLRQPPSQLGAKEAAPVQWQQTDTMQRLNDQLQKGLAKKSSDITGVATAMPTFTGRKTDAASVNEQVNGNEPVVEAPSSTPRNAFDRPVAPSRQPPTTASSVNQSLMDLLPPLNHTLPQDARRKAQSQVRTETGTADQVTSDGSTNENQAIAVPDFSQLAALDAKTPDEDAELQQGRRLPDASSENKTQVSPPMNARDGLASIPSGAQPPLIQTNNPKQQDPPAQPWTRPEFGPLGNSNPAGRNSTADIPKQNARIVANRIPPQAASNSSDPAQGSGQRPPQTNFVNRSTPPQREPAQTAPAQKRTRTSNATKELPYKSTNSKRSVKKLELQTNEFQNHITVEGESLQAISRKFFGKPDFYLDIYLANQDILDSPVRVPAGTKLKIPSYK